MEDQFARNIVTAYGGDASTVPGWPHGDFDSIFVIRLTRTGNKTTVTFTHDHEGLNGKLSNTFPGNAPPA
jgi:hypothetical protein